MSELGEFFQENDEMLLARDKRNRNATLDEVLELIEKEHQSRTSYKKRLRSRNGDLSFAAKMERNKTLIESRLLLSIKKRIQEKKDD